MFDQVGADDSERSPLRLRLMKTLVVTVVAAFLFGGLFVMTQLVD